MTASELTLGTLLVIGLLTTIAAVASVVVLGIFSLVAVRALISGAPPSTCGCIIIRREGPFGWHICTRNAALICCLLPSIGLAPGPLFTVAFGLFVVTIFRLRVGVVRAHAARVASH